VQRFGQFILMSTQNIVLFMGLVPSVSSSKSLIKAGGLVVNGASSSLLNYYVRPGDILQVTPRALRPVKAIADYHSWYFIRLKLSFVSFFQID